MKLQLASLHFRAISSAASEARMLAVALSFLTGNEGMDKKTEIVVLSQTI